MRMCKAVGHSCSDADDVNASEIQRHPVDSTYGNKQEFGGCWYVLACCCSTCTRADDWGIILKPQPPHARQKYEQKYGPKLVEFALF